MSARKEHRSVRSNRVLGQRNQSVVAVGAWVESGHEFLEHPAVLASLTDEWQERRKREDEENLRKFQQEVRHRVARLGKSKASSAEEVVRGGSREPPLRLSSPLEDNYMAGDTGRQVRLRLAACRMIPQEGEVTSELPGGRWNICQGRHRDANRLEDDEQQQDGEEEEEEEEEDHHPLSRQHRCALVRHNVTQQQQQQAATSSSSRSPPPARPTSVGRQLWDPDGGARPVFWPPADREEEEQRQRQSHFLLQRRHFMRLDRERAKEDSQHRKHLRRTARMKAEKEQFRVEEERRLEREQRLAALRRTLEQRELLVLERLKLEEDDRSAYRDRARHRQLHAQHASARSVEALRAQMKQRLSREEPELPPLCCCASTFWDSHPDTCANNCVFHNNPKAYVQALLSLMASLDSS